MKAELPAESVALAILHIDGVGYSKALSADDPTAILAVEQDMAAIHGILSSHEGKVWGRAGDSYLASFLTADVALDAAFELQNWADPSAGRSSLVFRIGVHFGNVFLIDGITGNAVNIAVRLEGQADPGGICISRAIQDLSNTEHRNRFVPSGPMRLKNINGQVETFRYRGSPASSVAAADNSITIAHKARRPSVLVRPMQALSNQPSARHLAIGFTADLITRLSRFRRLDVIGKGSSFAMGVDASDQIAAQHVDANYVVTGQLQMQRDKLRVNIGVFDARKGSAIWSESYDRALDDIFEVQSEITDIAVAAMSVHIDQIERDLARARNPDDLDAYELVVQARLEQLEDGLIGEKATSKAKRYFEQSAELDSRYAAAYAGIARTHCVQWRFGWSEDPEVSMNNASTYALRAIDVDENDAVAHSELGFVSLYQREHDRSLAAYGRAMQLNPSDVEIIAFYADALKHSGSPQQAIPLFERALRLNPAQPDLYQGNLAHAHFLLQDYDTAIDTIRKMRQPLTAQRVLTASLMMAKREDEGRLEAEKLKRHLPTFSAAEWCKIVPDKRPEDSALLQEGLERAGL